MARGSLTELSRRGLTFEPQLPKGERLGCFCLVVRPGTTRGLQIMAAPSRVPVATVIREALRAYAADGPLEGREREVWPALRLDIEKVL